MLLRTRPAERPQEPAVCVWGGELLRDLGRKEQRKVLLLVRVLS